MTESGGERERELNYVEREDRWNLRRDHVIDIVRGSSIIGERIDGI